MNKHHTILLAIGALIILALAVSLPGSPLRVSAKPCPDGCNVVLIMVDTLSAEHIGAYGYSRDTMPQTTAFFEKNGIIFENAMANSPWTLPSFITLYFSDLATNVTFRDLENENRPALQSSLRAGGYALKAIAPGPTYFISEAILRSYAPEEVRSEKRSAFVIAEEEYPLLAARNTPFFLLVHSLEVHDPYTADAPHDTKFEEHSEYPIVTAEDLLSQNRAPALDPEKVEVFKLRYDQAVSQVDARMATFLESISADDLKRTVIVLSSDHGEAFGEHGKLWHASSLYEEQLRIPLMMHIPGVAPRHIKEAVSLMDLAPTLLSLVHLPIPERFQGEDLTPLLSGGTLGKRAIPLANGMPFFLWNLPAYTIPDPPPTLRSSNALNSNKRIVEPTLYGVRIGSEKVVTDLRTPDYVEWYDLAKDPREQDDLAKKGEVALPPPLADALGKLILGQ